MDASTKRGVLVGLLIAGIGLGACIVKTEPAHRTRSRPVTAEKHKKHKHEKHKQKKHKHKKHKDD